jgi:hypothetical protein
MKPEMLMSKISDLKEQEQVLMILINQPVPGIVDDILEKFIIYLTHLCEVI